MKLSVLVLDTMSAICHHQHRISRRISISISSVAKRGLPDGRHPSGRRFNGARWSVDQRRGGLAVIGQHAQPVLGDVGDCRWRTDGQSADRYAGRAVDIVAGFAVSAAGDLQK